MSSNDGLIWACLLTGDGNVKEIGLKDLGSHGPQDGVLWSHWDRMSPATERWLRDQAYFEPIICDALLAEETRPRSLVVGDGLLTILRGVNLNTGEDPEDMISVRVWIDNHRVITMRSSRILATQDVRDRLEIGEGPKNSGDFLVALVRHLVDRMSPVLQGLDETVDTLEEQVVNAGIPMLRTQLSSARRTAIALRRFLAPQRDVLSQLQNARVAWLEDVHRSHLREVADRLARYVEDLDSARERAAITQEELAGRLSEQMNRTMYIVSVVAAIFLPLGLLTGLLGINVGGIPGSDIPWAFAAVCLILIALAVGGFWFFRRLKLLAADHKNTFMQMRKTLAPSRHVNQVLSLDSARSVKYRQPGSKER